MESKPSVSPSSFVDQQVFPGDVVLDLSKMTNQTIKLGGGLRQDGDVISVMKAGKLRFSKPNKYWVESSHKRIGTLLYVRVVKANTGMNPELSCMDASGKAAEYGPLKDGFMFESSTGLSRTLLSTPTCPVLETLGKKLAFEIAVGLNGRVWVNATSPSVIVLVANTIMQTESLSPAQQKIKDQHSRDAGCITDMIESEHGRNTYRHCVMKIIQTGSELQSLLWQTLLQVPQTKSPKTQGRGENVFSVFGLIAVQPVNHDSQDTKVEPVKETSPTSVFVNSEPIREEQVQNAVKFLSHPKVRGSPVIYRRSFLERKGLTKEEIDEAFRRVPDPTPAATATQTVVTTQDGQVKSSSNVQQQPPAQVVQPTPTGPVTSISKMGTLSRFHWYHAILAVGFLAASGAGTAVLFKNAVIPRLKSWIRRVVLEEDEEGQIKKNDSKPSIAEEAAAAAKAAAAAAADVARASQEMLTTKSEEKRCFEELISMLNVQVNEMKSMSSAIQNLEGKSIQGRIAVEEQDNRGVSGTTSRQPYVNGKADTDSHSVRSLSPPSSAEPSVPPHPKSYMEYILILYVQAVTMKHVAMELGLSLSRLEILKVDLQIPFEEIITNESIMAMIQRGEKPSNIREINDAPPNPNQPVSNPRLAPRPKYANINTTACCDQPWEVGQAQSSSVNAYPTQESSNSSAYEYPDNQLNGDDAAPWWQRKNVRITEIEAGEEQKRGSSNVLTNEQPARRSWVPPQPPPVVMPEAAAAIRQPKKASYQTEQLTDDQLLARAADGTDELQRITKFSESGGALEANGENCGLHSTEMPKEDNGTYLEA
ncbi:UNVERIFIED_CONTAM: Peroxisomal membrane protein PEX14 [Sesamum indicum]